MISKVDLILAIALLCAVACANSLKQSSLSKERPADDEVRELMPLIMEELRVKYPYEIASVEPLTYRRQVMGAFVYYVRAIVTEQSGEKAYIHLKILLVPFRTITKLIAIRTDVDETTPIEYFEGDHIEDCDP